MTNEQIFTVGHSSQSFDELMSLLMRHEITAVADVRSMPYSQFTPQFNREPIERSLAAGDIHYVFLGRELGARSEDLACYVDGRVQYGLLAETDLFHSGIDRLIQGASSERIAIMCTEKDPLDCHRTVLVARALFDAGVGIDHILPDGQLESQDAAVERLRERFGLSELSLFQSAQELGEEALLLQEHKIAYVDKEPAGLPAKEG